MQQTIIAILITLACAVAITTAIRVGHENTALAHEVAALEREIEQRQAMIQDMHHVLGHLPHLRPEVMCRETDMTPREMLWVLAEHLQELGVPVEIH